MYLRTSGPSRGACRPLRRLERSNVAAPVCVKGVARCHYSVRGVHVAWLKLAGGVIGLFAHVVRMRL